MVGANGILLNNALESFYYGEEDEDVLTGNRAGAGKRPLTESVVAMAFEEKEICGARVVLGAAEPDGLARVRRYKTFYYRL